MTPFLKNLGGGSTYRVLDIYLSHQAARLAKANRQLEHELLVSKSRLEKVQTQHERQMEHVKSTYQRKIDKLIRSRVVLRGRDFFLS